jgi:hypothetical protein
LPFIAWNNTKKRLPPLPESKGQQTPIKRR